jgi:HEPN domain-containing protein
MVSNAKNYYRAALERIEDAHLLHTEGHYAFAMYASGLAVECLLRAFRLLKDPSFEERHDLWELWRKTALMDAPRQSTYDRIYALLSEVSLRWRNSYRFAAENEVRAFLKKSGQHRGIKGDFLKYNSKKLYDAAKEFLRLGGLQWVQLNKK